GALAGATGALLLPGLLAATRDFAAPLGVVGSRASRRQFTDHRLMHQGNAHGPVKYRRQFQCGVALAAEYGDGRHRCLPSLAFCCGALVCLTLLRTSTRPPLAPGIAPRSKRRFCSGITRTTGRFSTVRRSPPMRPGRWCPGQTREGSDEAPMEPGARWNM